MQWLLFVNRRCGRHSGDASLVVALGSLGEGICLVAHAWRLSSVHAALTLYGGVETLITNSACGVAKTRRSRGWR